MNFQYKLETATAHSIKLMTLLVILWKEIILAILKVAAKLKSIFIENIILFWWKLINKTFNRVFQNHV